MISSVECVFSHRSHCMFQFVPRTIYTMRASVITCKCFYLASHTILVAVVQHQVIHMLEHELCQSYAIIEIVQYPIAVSFYLLSSIKWVAWPGIWKKKKKKYRLNDDCMFIQEMFHLRLRKICFIRQISETVLC